MDIPHENPNSPKFKVGDYAGIGCLVSSCGVCQYCKQGLEQFCVKSPIFTYGATDKYGQRTRGGYAKNIVVQESFGIKIPEKMNVAATAPLLCAGVTTFSPMQHWKMNPGHKVAVVGLGGLGHMAVKLFKAGGSDVTVFTTSPGKVSDAKRLGASEAILWSDKDAFKRNHETFDYMITTVPQSFDVNPFIDMLKVDGVMVNVGVLVPFDQGFNNQWLASRRKTLAGSFFGGIAETQQVIDYCAAKNISADVEVIPIDRVNEAWQRVVDKDVRYRFVIDMSTLHA